MDNSAVLQHFSDDRSSTDPVENGDRKDLALAAHPNDTVAVLQNSATSAKNTEILQRF
jgi:hypothetical protein